MAKVLGYEVISICIGKRYNAKYSHLFIFDLYIGKNLNDGGYCLIEIRESVFLDTLITLAGPLSNLLIGGIVLFLIRNSLVNLDYNHTFLVVLHFIYCFYLTYFATTQLAVGFFALIPCKYKDIKSDGAVILKNLKTLYKKRVYSVSSH